MTLLVLSTRKQYEALLAAGEDLSRLKILCDNPSLHSFLRAKAVSFEALDERVIKDRWQSINIWAYEKSLLWGDLLKGRRYFDGIELNKALYIFFAYYLANFLKNHLLAEYVYKVYMPQRVIVFDISDTTEMPFFNGNYFLNIFLRTIGSSKGIKISSIKIVSEEHTPPSGIKEKIRSLLQNVYGLVFRTGSGKEVFLVNGSVRYLGVVIKMIKDRCSNIVIYDHKFNFEQFRFCVRNNIDYIVPECLGKLKSSEGLAERYRRDFKEAVDILHRKRWFSYEGTDLSDYICKEVMAHSEGYIKKISQWATIYDSLILRYRIKGLIISEDWSSQGGFIAAFFKNTGIGVFCISHGYGAAEFSVPEGSRRFFLSETFVNSEFEAEYFSRRGWDRRHIHVTGIPRYDRIQFLKKTRKSIDKKMKMLFCGGTMLEYSPDDPLHRYHMSILRYTRGGLMGDCLKSVMEAIKGRDIELTVIPRYNNDENLWRDLIRNSRDGVDARFVSSQSDFFEAMSQSDAVLAAHWSTSILESVIFGKPAVVISYSGIEDPFPFKKEGLCKVAYSKKELKEIIDGLYESFKHSGGLKTGCEKNIFYLGINDGNNAKRTADKILEMSGIHER